MKQQKIQSDRFYLTSSSRGQSILVALQSRKGKKATFCEVSLCGTSDLLQGKIKLYRGEIIQSVDAATGEMVETCSFKVGKVTHTVSAIVFKASFTCTFGFNRTYEALLSGGRSSYAFLDVDGREGNLVKAHIRVGATYSHTQEVKVLNPLGGYYEVIRVIVQGQMLTFRANCSHPRLRKFFAS